MLASLLGLPSPDWSALAESITAIVALSAGVIASRQLREARRLRLEQAQPYVVAYAEHTPAGPFTIDIVIRNFGTTAAYDIEVEPGSFDADSAQQLIARAERSTERARAIIAARQAALATRVTLPLDRALASASVAELDAALLAWTQALAAAHADRTGNELKAAGELRFLDRAPDRVDELMDRGDYDEATDRLVALKAILVALPAIAERRRLLDGPSGR
jgi:hypothetical protein